MLTSQTRQELVALLLIGVPVTAAVVSRYNAEVCKVADIGVYSHYSTLAAVVAANRLPYIFLTTEME